MVARGVHGMHRKVHSDSRPVDGTTWRLGFRDVDVRANFAADCSALVAMSPADAPRSRPPVARPSRQQSALDDLLATE